MVINIDEFDKGFKLDFGLDFAPLYFNLKIKEKWGFGLDIGHIEASGNVDLSGNLLSFQQTENDKFGVGAAVFAEVGMPASFYIKKFKVNVRPSIFVPLVYTEPDISYSFRGITNPDGTAGTLVELNYNMLIYTPFSLDPGESKSLSSRQVLDSFNARSLGVDFSTGVEYPLFSWLDLGADLKNIPLIPSKLHYYVQMQDRLFADTSKIDFGDLIDGEEVPEEALHFPEDFDPVYGSADKFVLRPFKMVTYATYRPFKTPILSLIGFLGFAINPLYVKPASIEGGLKIRSDLANIFIPTLGIGYEDRMWKNSIDFIVNVRAFELDLGISFQSQNFVKSWQGAGFGVNFGMKFGW